MYKTLFFAHFLKSCAKVRIFYEPTKKNAQNILICAKTIVKWGTKEHK